MYKKITIDSSVFLSSLEKKDPHFILSKNFLGAVSKQQIPIFVPILVLLEVLHSYFRKTNSNVLTEKLFKHFINWNIKGGIRFLNMEAEFSVFFAIHHHKFNLKTSDSIIAITAQKLKCPLISWDKQLIKACGKNVLAMTPEEFLQKQI